MPVKSFFQRVGNLHSIASFVSLDTAYATNDFLTFIHGLPANPKRLQVTLVNIVGDAAWVPGDEIELGYSCSQLNPVPVAGFNILSDATNIYIKISGRVGASISFFQKASNAQSLLINTSWLVRVTGYYWTSGIAEFQSADQVITPSTIYTLPHGLGATPKYVRMILKNVIASIGYSVGDRIDFSVSKVDYAGGPVGGEINADSTNIYIRTATFATPFFVLDKATGAVVAIVNASWRFIVDGYLW